MKDFSDPLVRKLSIKISGCPNSCGQHWIGDIGFYGNARKIDGKEVPYYLMLLGGGYDSGEHHPVWSRDSEHSGPFGA